MRRRIAVIAPPWYPLPPHGYGGIELVVHLLVRELRARGDEVVVFGSAGSSAGVHALAPAGLAAELGGRTERLRELAYASRVGEALAELGPFDMVHDHCGMATLLLVAGAGRASVLHTVHGVVGNAEREYYAALPGSVRLVAISEAQRRSAPALRWAETVHNAVDVDALHPGRPAAKEPFLLCLARICPDKGQHVAIDVARRTGLRLVLAGKIEETSEGRDYFTRQVAPAIDGDRVVHLHNVAGDEKAGLLSRAVALLAPLHWEEPFGLAMAEAMVSGTPVIAFPRGAAPELVIPGVTGLLVDGAEAMAAAVREASAIDPWRCAAAARRRFSPAAMAASYGGLYDAMVGARSLLGSARGWPRAAPAGPER